jgi:uncharacterized membrane protein
VSDRTLRIAIAALALVGAGIASYLTAVKLSGAPIACATGGCETVAHSRYSAVGGIPVASFGLVAYLLVLASTFVVLDIAVVAAAALATASTLVAAYLVYVQASVLHAYCQWCLASDTIFAVLLVLTLVRALRLSPRAESAGRPGGSGPSTRPAAGRARGRREEPSRPSPRTG